MEFNIGDIFRMGTSTVIATQPRMPCYKLGVKFGRMDVIKKFLASGRSGIYFVKYHRKITSLSR